MKKQRNLILSVIMVALMALPMASMAQSYNDGSKGLFGMGGSDADNVRRTISTGSESGMTLGGSQTEDPTTPIGSGLLIMTVNSNATVAYYLNCTTGAVSTARNSANRCGFAVRLVRDAN